MHLGDKAPRSSALAIGDVSPGGSIEALWAERWAFMLVAGWYWSGEHFGDVDDLPVRNSHERGDLQLQAFADARGIRTQIHTHLADQVNRIAARSFDATSSCRSAWRSANIVAETSSVV